MDPEWEKAAWDREKHTTADIAIGFKGSRIPGFKGKAIRKKTLDSSSPTKLEKDQMYIDTQ